jgi:hypothetical protein
MTKLQQKFVEVLEVSQIDSFIPYIGKRACRPTKSRMALARCFLAKAVYNMLKFPENYVRVKVLPKILF